MMAIDDILGRSVSSAIKLQFSRDEEANAVYDLIVSENKLCKRMRLSKKLIVDEDDMILTKQQTNKKKIEWPSVWTYCRSDVFKLIGDKLKSESYGIEQDDFQGAVVTQNQLWDILKKANWLKKQVKFSENDDVVFLNEFNCCKTTLIDYLRKTNGQAIDETILQQLLNLTDEQV